MNIPFLLEELLKSKTPSGYEDAGQSDWATFVNANLGDNVVAEHDLLGNVWATINGATCKPNVMVVGHGDQIGIMVTGASDKGYIYFAAVGGVDVPIIPGSRVTFVNRNNLIGVVGRQPTHLKDDDDEDDPKKIKCRNLWIDIGASSKAEALKAAPVGSVACLSQFLPVHMQNDLITATAIDDKVGAYVAAEVLMRTMHDPMHYPEYDLPVMVTGVSAAQEEIGSFGAKVLAERINPTAAIVVDVGFATDTPDEDDAKRVGSVSLGAGPMLGIGPAINRVLNNCLTETANRLGIDVQMVPEPSETGTDADVIRLTGAGIPTVNVSIPVRYMHTPVEVCSLKDVENTVRLIHAALPHIVRIKDFSSWGCV